MTGWKSECLSNGFCQERLKLSFQLNKQAPPAAVTLFVTPSTTCPISYFANAGSSQLPILRILIGP